MQTQALQRPSVQVEVLGHDIERVLSPSALHTVTDVDEPQVVAPGVQLHARQTPEEHDCLSAQAAGVYPRPSGLQTRRSVMEPQLAVPGVQICDWQVPPTQEVAAPQGLSFQALPLALQTRSRRRSRHSRAPGVHTCRAQVRCGVQNSPVAQSASATQSTQ